MGGWVGWCVCVCARVGREEDGDKDVRIKRDEQLATRIVTPMLTVATNILALCNT